MTTRYTNEEWFSIIADVEHDIRINDQPYAGPAIGSPAFARTVDHTLLKLDATSSQIDDLCAEARVAGFATVCVRPNHVAQAAANLKGSEVQVASVIGFHEGTYDLSHKLRETHVSVEAGAHELDIVINFPLLKARRYGTIYNELAALRAAAPHPVLLKLIFETSQLSSHDIVAAGVLAGYASYDFVKTSTGFCGHGATVDHVSLMKAVCVSLERKGVVAGMRVKASGGIRTLADARAMIDAGASRLGTSGGVWIIKEGKEVVEGRARVEDGGNRPGMATRLFTDY